MKNRITLLFWIVSLLVCLGCSGGNQAAPIPPVQVPVVTVKPGPGLHFPRARHSELLLSDGRVAIIGGANPDGPSVPVCELFNPQDSSISDGGQLLFPRWGAACLLLGDGRVAILGGNLNSQGGRATQIEIWDPATKLSAHVGNLQTLHGEGLSIATLVDGKILVFGGAGFGAPELVDPSTWTSEVLSFQGPNRGGQAMARLPNGDVAFAGGFNGLVALGDRWVYSWQSKQFIRSDTECCLESPRADPSGIVLRDGRWALIGGGGDYNQPGLKSTEIYSSPDGPRLATTQGATGLVSGTVTPLPNDLALLVGGREGAGLIVPGTTITRVYDPIKGTYQDGQPLSVGRWAHTATRLRDGRILIVGGTIGQGALASTEILTVP